jgi:hypothetical protein
VDDPSAPPSRRLRRSDRDPAAADRPDATRPDAAENPEDAPDTALSGRLDLAGLSIVGITRRRVGWASTAFVAVWIVVVFARQVGDAQAASNRAIQVAEDNAALAAEVQALEGELALIVQPEYVGIEARGVGLGNPKEIPFTLDPSVPSAVDGAPGSASVRLGAAADRRTPLESWLSLLFGPGD